MFSFRNNSVNRLLCMWLAVSALSVRAEDRQPDKWKSADGKFGLVSATPSKVTLLRLDNHKQLEGTWLKMPLPMRKEIANFWADQDKQQLDKVQKAFASNRNQVKGTYEQLKALHVDFPMSPYAGLALGVSYAGLMNDQDKALSVLKQVALRLETQRGANPEAHTNTLASCYCDMAVCALKDKKADNGLSFLIKSMDAHPTPVVVHNARQLAVISTNKEAFLKLEEADQKKLAKMLEDLPEPKERFQAGWHYSLIVDNNSFNRANPLANNAGLTPPADGMRLFDAIVGVAVSENSVVFPDRFCSQAITDSILVSYVPQAASHPITINDVLVETEDVSTQFQSSLTRFRPAIKTANKKLGLAGFTIPDRAFKPAQLSTQEPSVNLDAKVFGLDKSSKEKLAIKSVDTSIKSLNGLKGLELTNINVLSVVDSPILDRDLCFMGWVGGRGSPSPKILSAPEIRTWLERSARLPLSPTAPVGTTESLVPIIAWVPVAASSNGSALFPGQGELTSIVRDEWCIPCGGKGFFKCPNCLKGVVTYKDMVQTGVNPLNNSPVYSAAALKRPCEACHAKGFFDCPHCVNGHIQKGSQASR